ncbi:integral membrane protein [Amycolatopsis mediterranei S699]|uniref:Integral membrane protein n=2 Tax=Amycolatopsis mediterranei TaxID=33910 RepID=A0A0H3D4T9_AMYMU|nr:SHOCT domain-containing protein [Amycolatopsis mediterranei]ADJ45681.1 integral membrane protein [Amycolatopsis mediterranei U32]AEK42461.1 integral membrane protein [Amycolatopsis mediterranei S699]AFO77392.1 integral membrane protein [Amycolatopsis mediterranei S699]AGT84520.1 integral membrane protein [Amycolatopsis mediterranei RB]KDO05936.1 membrane protein [Amycolatopsis mediterranei]
MALASAEYPFLGLMWTMLVFFCWIAWFWLLFLAFGDLFRRDDVSGWAKAGWTVLLIVLPFLGVLLYLVTQGRHLPERQRAREAAARDRFDGYVRSVSTSDTTGAAQIAQARRLLEEGVIDDAEYQALKRKALAR